MIFEFDSTPVRIAGTAEAPLFVAADVCRILGLSNPTMAIQELEEDERTLSSIEGASNGLPVNCVTESGLYSLIFRSRKPQAKVFRRWVTGTVLPAIRQTGRYAVEAAAAPADLEPGLQAYLVVVRELVKLGARAERQMRRETGILRASLQYERARRARAEVRVLEMTVERDRMN